MTSDTYNPQFLLPRYFQFKRMIDKDGNTGTMYWLDRDPDDKRRKQMEAASCQFAHSRKEYAPEIISTVVFVPDGTEFDYE